MICPICNHTMTYNDQLVPYTDKAWQFKVFDCPGCDVRYAADVDTTNIHNNVPVHEDIHIKQAGGYSQHYSQATAIKKAIEKNNLSLVKKLATASSSHKHIWQYLEQHGRGKRILELGASSGFFTAALRAHGFSAVGMDISQTAVDFANKHFGNHFFQSIPAKERFDIICFVGVIGCVENPRTFISQYLPLLNKNGIIICNVPNKQRLREDNIIWKGTMPPDLHFYFSQKTIPFLLEKNSSYTTKELHDYKKLAKDFLIHKNPSRESIKRQYTAQPALAQKTKTPHTYIKNGILFMIGWILYHSHIYRRADLYGLILYISI